MPGRSAAVIADFSQRTQKPSKQSFQKSEFKEQVKLLY
jgi:hypothetical protein